MPTRRLCALIFAACAAPRVIVLFATSQPPPNYYWEIATSLLASGSYGFASGVTTAIEPLYPYFLAAARLVTGDSFVLVMLLQVLLASTAGVFLFLLTVRLTASRRAALAAAVLYALYPYYVRQSVAPHEMTMSIVLLTATAWQYYRTTPRSSAESENIREAALCGFWCGLLVLLRFSFAPVWIGAVALLLLQRRGRAAAAVIIVSMLMLAPWLLRTQRVDGSVLPTRVGENLFIASCEFAEEVLPFYDADLMVRYAYSTVHADRVAARVPPALIERTVDDALMRRAIDCIRQDPLRAVRLKLRNLLYVFAPVLLPAHARLDEAVAFVENGRLRFLNIQPRPLFDTWAHAVAHSVILLAAAAGLLVRRQQLRRDAFLLVIVASIAAVYAVFFPTTRLTAPMMVVLMFYAAVGIAGVDGRAFRAPRS